MRRALVLVALGVVLSGAATAHGSSDGAWARRIVVKQSDLPAGWVPAAPGGGEMGCEQPRVRSVRTTARAVSRLFQHNGIQDSVGSVAQIVRSTRQARVAFTHLVRYSYATCFGRIAREKTAGTGVEVTSVVASSPPAPRVAGRVAARRVTIQFTAQNAMVTTQYDLVFVQRGRALSTVLFATLSTSDPAFARSVVAKVAARMSHR